MAAKDPRLPECPPEPDRSGRPDCADHQLLSRFVAGGDRAAFELLVRRHGPALLRAARRLLHSHHDAEDAVQAAFLVLARKARQVRRGEGVGGWLYRVMCRAALRLRKAVRQDRQRITVALRSQTRAADQDPPSTRSDDPLTLALEELHRIPARYRAPLVLCYLQGLSIAQAAEELGCPEGTVCSRLERGKAKLRERLARRGVLRFAPASLALVGEGCVGFTPSLAQQWTEAAIHSAGLGQSGAAMVSGAAVVSVRVRELADAVTWELSVTRWRFAAALCIGLLVAGAGTLAVANGFDDHPSGPPAHRSVLLTETPASAADSPAKSPQPDAKPDALDGTWELVRYEFGGEALPRRPGVMTTYEFRNAKLFIHDRWEDKAQGTEFVETQKATMVLDRTKSPMTVDLRIEGSPLAVGIIEWDGKRLRMCYTYEGARPRDWKIKRFERVCFVELRRIP